MAGFTKLFSSIVGSTIWRAANHIRIVWITLLALADADGVVEVSVPGLADFARVSLEECEEALQRLQEPDPYSRTPDHDGRRIEPVLGGWLLLNHAAYRERTDKDSRREYLRLKKAESRAKSRGVNTGQHQSTPVSPGQQKSTQEEAEGDPDTEIKSVPPNPLPGGPIVRLSTRKPSKAEREWAEKILDTYRFRAGCPHDAEHPCDTRAKCIGKLVMLQRQQTLDGMREEMTAP